MFGGYSINADHFNSNTTKITGIFKELEKIIFLEIDWLRLESVKLNTAETNLCLLMPILVS